MLLFIVIHGGLRIMMGQHARSESLFYYFGNEDQVHRNLLILLEKLSLRQIVIKLLKCFLTAGLASSNPGSGAILPLLAP